MPYTMRHSATGTLLAYVQRNGYRLAYYGIALWQDEPDGRQMAEALAEAGLGPEHAAGRLEAWELLDLTEHEAKMANVKLRNDPQRVVVWRDGKISEAHSSEE